MHWKDGFGSDFTYELIGWYSSLDAAFGKAFIVYSGEPRALRLLGTIGGVAHEQNSVQDRRNSRYLKTDFCENHVRKAILFGSYSNGSQNENSDIDLLVDSGLRGLSFYGLLEDATEALDMEVDLIDTSQVVLERV